MAVVNATRELVASFTERFVVPLQRDRREAFAYQDPRLSELHQRFLDICRLHMPENLVGKQHVTGPDIHRIRKLETIARVGTPGAIQRGLIDVDTNVAVCRNDFAVAAIAASKIDNILQEEFGLDPLPIAGRIRLQTVQCANTVWLFI